VNDNPLFGDQYFLLLKSYMIDAQEQFLFDTSELGKKMVVAEIPPEDIIEIHELALVRLIKESPHIQLHDVAYFASKPLMELQMAYGFFFRKEREGYYQYQKEPIKEQIKAHNSQIKAFSQQYCSLLRCYITNTQEELLAEAVDLGKRMAQAEIPPADIAEIHELALDSVINELPNISMKDVIHLASKPLMELQIAYSMAFQIELEHRRQYQNELKNQKERLRKNHNILAMAQKIAHIGSGEWDIEKNQVTCSDEMYRILGVEPKTFDRLLDWEAIFKLIHPDDLERVRKTCQQMWDERLPIPIEFCICRPDGTVRMVSCQAEIIFNGNKEPIRIINTVQDITEHKQIERALEKYRNQLECLVEEQTRELQISHEKSRQTERLAIIGKLSGSIAHEIRNPLGVINSSVYYLKMKLQNADEKTCSHLNRIQNQVNHSTVIIQSLLDLTRMKEPIKVRLNIVNVIETVFYRVSKNIEVVKTVPTGEFFVEADEQQISIMFKNLVTNAVQAMNNQGILEVTVDKSSNGWISVSFKDSGIGISPENLEKIFQPFFSTKTIGIGFGLSICQMIIEKHGCTIRAQSKVGKGTSFIVGFPPIKTENANFLKII
jgi:PAS domain S-box-containing protein